MKIQTYRLFIFTFTVISITACQTNRYNNIASSYWKYNDDDIAYEIYFRPDGHISSYHPDDATPENDYWKQKGKRVTIYMNDRYAIYKGQLINDSTLVGQGKSKGFQWNWKANFISKD